MKIKMLKAYQLISPGDVVDFPDDISESLIRRGAARKIEVLEHAKKKNKKAKRYEIA